MPTDISSLLSLIAARMVLAETASTSPYLAMATLIAPELAITPDHVFGNRKRSGLNVKLHFDGHPDIPIETDATVVAHDSKADFAVLKLKSGLRLNLPSQALAGADPPSGASWQSLIITPATPKGEYVTGTVVEPRTIDGIEHLGLLTPRKSESGSSGAPIVVNDRIVGIMARSNHALEDNQWFAIPVSAMLQSKEGDLIRSAMAADISSGAGQASDAVETDAESEMALYRRISSSSLALDALSLADGIRARMHRDSVHMEHLIAALFATANGPAQKVMAEARVNRDKIFVILSGHAKQRFPALDGFTPSRLTSLPPLSRHARQALVEARVMANEYKSKEILSRHLLYGALSVTDCDLVKRLLELGLDKNKIEMGRVAAAGGPLIPGYWSDAAKGKDLKDLLGISREVETLCSVLAAKDVKPPLSLGLFGDWGSGKSFFMGEMEKRIKSLKEEAKNDPDSPYCREIVQLWFNAWHYIDTELWASLATEIFDGLAVSLIPQNKKEELDYKRDQLIAREGELEAEKRKQREIERRLVENEKGKTEIETSPRQVIVEAYRFAERQPKAREMARQVEENFNEKIKEAADELGVSTDKVKEQLLEAHGLWRQIRAVWVAMGRVKKSNLWMLYVLAAIVLPATVLALLQSYHPAWQTIITKILTVLTTLLALLAPFIGPAKKALKILGDAIESNREKLEKERIELQGMLEEQQMQTAKKSAEVAAVKEDLEKLRAGRKIADFIKQRNASTDYTKYQGVIARAHADFEQLSNLLLQEQAEPPDDSTRVLPAIDRIILYIDDLDRCPEDKVVQVLQAVHLLLAFPIFVVVVGVDPRWLLHSLKQHSSAFREHKEEDHLPAEEDKHWRSTRSSLNLERGPNHQLSEEDKHWRSTPLNYLEKIFQIPFTLRPMGKGGFEELIEALAASPKTEQQLKTEAKPESKSPPAPETAAPSDTKPAGEQAAHNEPRQTPQRESTPASAVTDKPERDAGAAKKINPEHLRIEDWEREVMKKLFPLIPSPRAAKRFVNIYRLLRVSAPTKNRAAFIGDEEHGQHRAALVLLAMLIGYPSEATDVLRGLLELKQKLRQELLQIQNIRPAREQKKPREVEWWQFFQQFDPGPSNNNGTGPDAGSPRAEEAERWRELKTKLEETGLIQTHQSCDDFIEWAEEVARYSFQSGRVLLGLQQAQASADD